MSNIILDCDLMRYRDSGLYHYCLNLATYVNRQWQSSNRSMKCYVPLQEKDTFPHSHTIVEKKWHRFVRPFLHDCRIWHAPFQSGRILPRPVGRTKILLTIHDLNALHEGKPRAEQEKSLAHTQRLIDSSDALVCISEFTRGDVLRHCDVRNKPVHVVHNGTHAVGDASLTPTSYRPSRPFLFTLGYVNRKKNFSVLVPLLVNTDYELVIAGRLDEADYVESIKQLAVELGVSDRLHILGPISEGEKGWYLQHCAAFLLPSLAEGFGAPVVEAMQFGKPLFLSNRTSLPEIGGEEAFYFEDFHPDHMSRVLAEGMARYSRNGLARRIMERGKEFNWTQKAKEYIRIYESLYH